MKKNIVFVGFLPGFGGAEKSMIMTANGLSKLGHNVTIISMKDNNVVYEIDSQVKYIFIPDKNKNKFSKQISRFIDLKRVLMKIKPDIVISFWLQPAFFTAYISKCIGCKVIYSERGDPSDKEYHGIKGIIRFLTFCLTDGFVFQTQGAKEYFSKKIQEKSVVINNPVYVKYDDYNIPIERKKVITNVGRLHSQKNQLLLINAFSKINELFPDYVLEIYGEGMLKDKLNQQIEALGLIDRVILKGTTKKILEQIVDSSMFVLSSDYEGMPNALMEAMALGLPCISTDCKPGGARELINHKLNGLICERKSEEKLFESMKYMIENKVSAQNMGIKAKEICNTHCTDVIFKKWEEYILRF